MLFFSSFNWVAETDYNVCQIETFTKQTLLKSFKLELRKLAGLPFWNLRSSLRAANDERRLTVVERVHHGLFLRPHHGWIHGEILSLKTWKWWREFFRRCHRWASQCVWYGHVRVHRSEWSHSCCDVGNCHSLFLSTGLFIISFGYCTGESSLLFLVGFIVIVKGLYASVACDLHNIWAFNVCSLQLADCCLSSTVNRELFVTFFEAGTRHSCFHHVAYSFYAHWLSFEPDVVIQSSVSFDTEVERTWPSHA